MGKLLEITSATSDLRVAEMLSEECLQLTDAPYRFSINHDIRPPKNMRCPVEYTWTRKDRCGFETKSREAMRKWLTAALLHGYSVYYVRRDGVEHPMYNILSARRRAELHQTMRDNPDDDIPF